MGKEKTSVNFDVSCAHHFGSSLLRHHTFGSLKLHVSMFPSPTYAGFSTQVSSSSMRIAMAITATGRLPGVPRDSDAIRGVKK